MERTCDIKCVLNFLMFSASYSYRSGPAFANKDMGFSCCRVPWIRRLIFIQGFFCFPHFFLSYKRTFSTHHSVWCILCFNDNTLCCSTEFPYEDIVSHYTIICFTYNLFFSLVMAGKAWESSWNKLPYLAWKSWPIIYISRCWGILYIYFKFGV